MDNRNNHNIMDKNHFVKMVSDASRLNGHYMDDYTAGLLFDRFLDIEYVELETILNRLLEAGTKITYKAINDSRLKKKKEEVKEEELEVIIECSDDCKQCKKIKAACQKLNDIGTDYVGRIGRGQIHYKQAMKELHEMFPHFGFDKKIGRCVGVMLDKHGEATSLYKYDED